MKKLIKVVSLLTILSGCGVAEDTPLTSSEPLPAEAEMPSSKTPPDLEVNAAGIEVPARLGSYSWTYQDGNGGFVSTHASGGPPTELVNMASPTVVPSVAEVDLQFEEEPLDYRIEIWRETGEVIPIPGEIELEDLNGITVFNVIAEWEHGKGNYSFAVDVQH